MTDITKPADYEVTARNTSADHTGSIHDDDSAQRFGYTGGLVPGITLYGYMCHVLAEAWGTPWIRHGTMRSRSIRPAYEGERIVVTVTAFGSDADGQNAELAVLRDDPQKPLAVGRATLPETFPEPPAVLPVRVLDMPVPPPLAAVGAIPVGHEMGTTAVTLTDADLDEYLDKLGESHPYYHDERVFPPSYIQQLTTRVERDNFEYETPTIYVESSAQHFGELRVGDEIRCPGVVTGFHERKGNHYIDVEQYVLAGERIVAFGTRDSIYHARATRS